uniref:Tyrosine-protein kinase receptor n=2 Tax=Lygus hesperus TaxID=30085 RepID=A0A0A9YBQ5_LYGHE
MGSDTCQHYNVSSGCYVHNKTGEVALIKIIIILVITCSSVFVTYAVSTDSPTSSPDDDKTLGVCRSVDVRNSVQMFSALKGCRIVEGFVQIVLIDRANDSDYSGISFPELTEITGYLLFYRVQGLRSIGQIFPNLAVLRGSTLFLNYALVVFEMLHLQEIGLTSLTDILRGAVYIVKNPMLCFWDTIDWDLIAPNGKGLHYFDGNKMSNVCPKCPTNQTCPLSLTTTDSETLCWNSRYCQRICPSHCNGSSCSASGECCHSTCLGGCQGGLDSGHCVACRNYRLLKRCVNKCPDKTYEYLNHRCLDEQQCYAKAKPLETEFNTREYPYKPFNGKCTISCPPGFLEVRANDGKYKCERCTGICKKECPASNIDSIASAQKLHGCTSIKGALNIQIRGGSNVVKELEENLNMVEEIDDYLKVVRSFPLVSLNFLKNLRVIHGQKLESSKYALVVLDNQNLVELWDWKTRSSDFQIKQGKLFFHFNPKLCLSKIEKLRDVANLGNFTDLEVAKSSNGDKVACNVTTLRVEVYKKRSQAALIKWEQFKGPDTRSLLGYVVYLIEAPYQNVTMYDGRDACGGDGWRVEDVSVENKDKWINHLLARLKPFTQYALYVKTYTIASEKDGAQSQIQYFRTAADTPTEPRMLKVYKDKSYELRVEWQPPLHPNGNLTHYIVSYVHEKDSEDTVEQRNYCSEPIDHNLIDRQKNEEQQTQQKTKETTDEPKDENCHCPQKVVDNTQREKEIHFEDQLQNLIYVKRNTVSRGKRSTSENQLDSEEKSSIQKLEGPRVVSVIVNTTSYTIRDLHHFALYNIKVRACREKEDENDTNTSHHCSSESLTSARTKPRVTADDLDPQYPFWEISNKSTSEVLLRWMEPADPNSLIVNYEIEYRRVDHENYKPIIECVTSKQFQSSGNIYILRNLSPGNYSLRISATSLARKGNWTVPKYFFIEEDSTLTFLHWALVILTILFIIMVFVVFYFRKQYTKVPDRKLITSVNPEYVPTVYEPDDWEVSRSRVKLLKEIGQGSFGMVYDGIMKSVDGTQDLPCAIKTVNVQAADRDRIEFLNEASVMKAFTTHHVVKLLGVVSQGQPTLVIMELMGLGDLKSYLRSCRPEHSDENPSLKPPTLKRILRMAAEIADGMAYLSAKKFVHRDLAARNCMVASDLTVKIGDFGMTRDIYETEYYRKGTKGLLPVRWMAPESLKDGVFTSQSDAWSYGVVLYEMATLASQPYQGLSNEQVLKYVIEGGIMERPDKCPDKLYNVMAICWKHKPSIRPTFIEIINMLVNDLSPDFQAVSFYHSEEGVDQRVTLTTENTPLRVSREIEDFSLSDDEDYKDPHSSVSSKVSNGSTTPNGYIPQPVVKTTKC